MVVRVALGAIGGTLAGLLFGYILESRWRLVWCLALCLHGLALHANDAHPCWTEQLWLHAQSLAGHRGGARCGLNVFTRSTLARWLS